ncbi:MAG: GNAT family N-acetyltransferase [Defluviitaleaceae bacterium]|nr:GNAT family N-acetyltransferase [Defluviitaleaceae bacterium]
MDVIVNGKGFEFVLNSVQDEKYRESYFCLIDRVFGLDFRPWYDEGFCGDSFIPYTLFDDGVAVASCSVLVNDFMWRGNLRRYVQLSTIATDKQYRGLGLSKWLMERVLAEWKGKCDAAYLYANDTVVDFYPQFGFSVAQEHRYSLPVVKKDGDFRKLDLENESDIELLIKKHDGGNPFSLLSMHNGSDIMMFHCLYFLDEDIYYIEKYDAVVIAGQKDGKMFCYDIYSDGGHDMGDLLGIIADEGVCTATLGFTPKCADGFAVEMANEKNTTFFVMDGMENILADEKVTFPFLSRA